MEILVTFFGTMFAGALTLLGVATVCWIYETSKPGAPAPTPSLWVWLDSLKIIPGGKAGIAAHGIGALVLLSFGIGIFAEGMTDYMTDSESPQLLALAIGSEGEHRFKCLFTEKEDNWRHTGIGREIFTTEHGSNYFAAILGPTLSNLNTVKIGELDDPRDHWLRRKLTRFYQSIFKNHPLKGPFSDVNRLYYPAKNWASGQEFHSRELENLQMRVDWSRSTFLIVVLVPLMTLVFIWLRPSAWLSIYGALIRAFSIFAIILILVISGGDTSGFLIAFAIVLFAVLGVGIATAVKKSNPKLTSRLALVFLMVGVIAFASRQGYAQFENQFNERAFGYYMSHLQRELWISKTSTNSERLVPYPKPK